MYYSPVSALIPVLKLPPPTESDVQPQLRTRREPGSRGSRNPSVSKLMVFRPVLHMLQLPVSKIILPRSANGFLCSLVTPIYRAADAVVWNLYKCAFCIL